MSAVDFTSLAVGDTLPRRAVEIDRERLVAYAAFSGDRNRIHWDEAYASEVGLPGVIAHGMFTMASAAAMVEDWAGSGAYVAEYRTKFTGLVPVPYKGTATVDVAGVVKSVDADSRSAVVELTVTFGEAKVLGNARLTVRWL